MRAYSQSLGVWFYLQLRGVQSESKCLVLFAAMRRTVRVWVFGSICSYEAYSQSLGVLVLFADTRRTVRV